MFINFRKQTVVRIVKAILPCLIAAVLCNAVCSRLNAANGSVPSPKIRGEIIINRTNAAWQSQQLQEPCIVPNPKDPTRLVMFYSGVPASWVGRRQEIEVGPMSGESNVVFWLRSRGIDPTRERVQAVFQRAKSVDRVLLDHEIRAVLAALDETRVTD